jgi:hypothetical protein
MKIVFCTTCKNRAFHLAKTLPKNLADNPRSTFLILDYGSEDNLLSVLEPHLQPGRLVVFSYKTASPFRMAHAKNMAHRLGILEGADVLVNLDADNYTGTGFEDFIEKVFQDNQNAFLWSGLVKGKGKKLRGVSGRIVVTPNAFIKAGGYNEKYNTWAPDDKDFNARISALGYQPIEIERDYLEAIPHGDGLRFREYPHISDKNWEDAELPKLKTAVANYGDIGLGRVFRLDGSCIDLEPIPTRIFGIGTHKTMTTSLNVALKILGYESAHWESGSWVRDVLDEMRKSKVSPTLEKFYAISDLPMNILYKELDHAYPGSKFILTIRDEIDWLRSVRDHFSYRNPHRWEWDKFPISNRIHQEMYGRTDFDAVVFLERYRRHNAEVIKYFKNRPNDLLIMTQPRWTDLCRFLERPVPAAPYPWAFATKKHKTNKIIL